MRAAPLRFEDARLVTGEGRYVGNLVDASTLHCAFVRSVDPHGTLAAFEVDEARGAPGVVAVLTAADLGLADIPDVTGRGPGNQAMTRPPLARDRVRYVGEPLAVVIAENAYQAADAADAVWAEVEPLPPVVDAEAALDDRHLLFPKAGTNVVSRTVIPRAAPPPQWPVSVTIEAHQQRLAPAPIEPLAILAEPASRGLHVWCGHQAPHRLRAQLAAQLGLDPADVHVTVPDVGGAFGMKGMLFGEYLVVAAAALRLGRRVVWLETRSEQFLSGTHGRAQRHRVTLAGEPSGRIRAARLDLLAEVGAYPHNGSPVPWFSRYMATGPYDIPDVEVTTTIVVTNRAPTGSYRGAGRPEAAFAIERAVEEFGRVVGLDAAEVRRHNFITSAAMPHRTLTGALYDGGDYAGALDLALDLAGAADVRREQRERRAAGHPGKELGLGIGAFVERAGGAADSMEYAKVELDGDCTVVVRVGSCSQGQGHDTVWRQLAGEVFGLDPRAVRVLAGDTDDVEDGVGTFGSRSAQIAGSAIVRTATVVRERAREMAGDLLEVAAVDLVLDGGVFSIRGDPTSSISLAELAKQGADLLVAEERYSPGAQTFPYGVYAAVVEVDIETGKVELVRLAAVDDCGNVLHPQIVEGQIHGSIMQGVGQALYEELHYDEEGQLRTATFADYALPSAVEMPPLLAARLVTPAPSNPLGVKGAGEAGCIGAPPAIVHAVLDALSPYGVTDLRMPLTPERVWRAIGGATTT